MNNKMLLIKIGDWKDTLLLKIIVKGGDILVSCAGTVGELYTLPTEAETGLINQALMRIRVHDDVNQIWFCYAFNNMIKQFSNKYSNGSAITNIPPWGALKVHSNNIDNAPVTADPITNAGIVLNGSADANFHHFRDLILLS